MNAIWQFADQRLQIGQHIQIAGLPDVFESVDGVGGRKRNTQPDIAEPERAVLKELLVTKERGKRLGGVGGEKQQADDGEAGDDGDGQQRHEPSTLAAG